MNRPLKRASATLAIGALAVSGLAFATVLPANAAPGECVATTDTVKVFGFNDFHGRIAAATKLFTPVEAARAAGDDVLLLSSGDNIGASLFESMVANDTPTLDVLNAIGLDVSTVGNHEFDKGWADLAGRVSSGSDFPYLGANVYDAGTTDVADPLQAYEIFNVAGVDIAVVGAVTADTPSMVDPSSITAISFGDPVEAVNRVTEDLLDGDPANGEADVVIASFHEGAASGSLTAAENAAASDAFNSIYHEVDGRVAAIFNAHTHQAYSWTTTQGVPVIQAGQYAERIAELELSIDADNGAVCGSEVTIHDQRTVTAGTSAALSEIDEIVSAAYDYADEEGKRVIGFAEKAISTALDGSANTRDTESPMTNLAAQMFYEVLSDADADNFIGLQNPGGTRDSFDRGDITYREAALTLPFANSLFTTQITGEQFVTVLEQQWQRNPANEIPSRPFLQLGLSDNVSYTYDESLPEGERITSVTINGAPIDPAKLYTVGSGSFLISGGDNFWELGKGTNTTDTGRADLEAWVEWVGSHDSLTPDYSKRGVSTRLPAADVLVPGGEPLTYTFGVTLDGGVAQQTLDMLLNDSGGKVSPPLANTSITARIGGVVVGQGDVANGAGSVDVRLGAGQVSTGEHQIDFTVHPSGTVISLPVTVGEAAPPKPGYTRSAPYTLPGLHKDLNGRDWLTTCQPYSQTERCTTLIWGTSVKNVGGRYVQTNGWAFNNMTYLPAPKSLWGANPLANNGEFVSAGRNWKTECGTPATGRDGCRSYVEATVIEAVPGGGYRPATKFVFNNIVMFQQ